jgi:hypothetical protein
MRSPRRTARPNPRTPRYPSKSSVTPTLPRPSNTRRARARPRRARRANRWSTPRRKRQALRGTRRPRTTKSVRWTPRQGRKCSRGFAHRRDVPCTRDPARCSFCLAGAGSSDTEARSSHLRCPDLRFPPPRSWPPRVRPRGDTSDTTRSRSRRSRWCSPRRRQEPMPGSRLLADHATLSPSPKATTPPLPRLDAPWSFFGVHARASCAATFPKTRASTRRTRRSRRKARRR